MEEKKAGKSPFAEVAQIGVLVRDLEKAIEYYESFGIGPFKIFEGLPNLEREVYGKPVTDVQNRVASASWGNGVTIELVQPVSGESVQKEFLEKHGEGINHVGFYVDNLDEEIARMEKRGFKVVSGGSINGVTRFAYMDTDKVGGVIFEMFPRPKK